MLNTQICNAYGLLQYQMDNFDQQLFNELVKDWLQTTPQSKKYWLVAVNIAVNNFTPVHGQVPSQMTITSFLQKWNSPSHDSTMSPLSMPQTSTSQTVDTVLRASEYTSSWEEDDLWADTTGDFEPIFER
eukprot:13888542-Ditylum_brightwellii.AAC.1